MMMVELTAKTMVSASLFKVLPTADFGALVRQAFCTMTSTARTNAASVKSTVRFLGRRECQYVIPANALANEARNVPVSLEILPLPALAITGSSSLRPSKIITASELAVKRGGVETADHGKSIETKAALNCSGKTPHELTFCVDSFIFRELDFTLFEALCDVTGTYRGDDGRRSGRVAQEVCHHNSGQGIRLRLLERGYGFSKFTNRDEREVARAVIILRLARLNSGDCRTRVTGD